METTADFSQPLNRVSPVTIKDCGAGPGAKESGLMAKSLLGSACWRCSCEDSEAHSPLSSSTGFPDSRSLGFECVAYFTKLAVVVRRQGRGLEGQEADQQGREGKR